MSYTYSYPLYSKSISNYCDKCLKFLKSGESLTQQICHKSYCFRCLSLLYQLQYLSQQPDIIIELYCGHYVDRTVIETIFKEHCINCGAQYNEKSDVEMKDKTKLCRNCFDLQANRYKNFLMECVSCNKIIRTLSFLADAQIILCKNCVTTQSTLQSKLMKEQEEEIPYNPKKGQPIVQPPSKLKKEQSEPDEDVSIVSRFSAFDISDSDTNIENEEKKHKKMKITSKHSVQIRVQNFKITVHTDSEKRDICATCCCMISEEGLMIDKEKKVCRVCFMTNFDLREAGFQRSTVKSSREKNIYTSAPKNRGLEKPSDAGRTMKKSSIFGGTESVATQPNPSILDPFKFTTSQAAKSKSNLSPWQNPTIQADKLCEICQQKKYMIIRSDKKKVCSGCYGKK